MSKALYPGTFDPVTLGHIDIIERTLHLFDEVTIAIAVSESKKPIFSLEERIDHINQIFNNNNKVKAIGFSGLVVDLAKEQGSNILIRGLRAVSDFEYEVQLSNLNRSMNPNIESIFLSPDEKYSFISSSIIKDIARHDGNLENLVDVYVEKKLREKVS